MAEINEANSVLSDAEKRAAYDQLGQHQPGQDFRPPPGWDDGMEFSGRGFSERDSAEFSDFFSEIFGRRAAQGSSFHSRSNDHHARVLLELEDAFKPHARFHPQGSDLHMTLPVAPWEAALGAVVPVDLPGGTLNVRIPAGAQTGRQLRIRGKGIPSTPPGDVYFDIRIVAPPAETPKAKELYESLQKEMNFDPRQAWGHEP